MIDQKASIFKSLTLVVLLLIIGIVALGVILGAIEIFVELWDSGICGFIIAIPFGVAVIGSFGQLTLGIAAILFSRANFSLGDILGVTIMALIYGTISVVIFIAVAAIFIE